MLYEVQINDRGQITIPKELRDTVNLQAYDRSKLSIGSDGKLVLYKSDFFDDLEDLIRKDIESEGLSAEQIEKKLPERKKELGKALIKCALAYLRLDFFELARKTTSENRMSTPEALTLFSRGLHPH